MPRCSDRAAKRACRDTSWADGSALLAPARTPQNVVDRLASEVRKAVADPKLKERLTEQGLDVVGSSSEEMLAVMQADTKKWAEVIAATGAKIPQ